MASAAFSHKKIIHHHLLHAALLIFSISILLAGSLNRSIVLAALDNGGLAALSNQQRAANGKADLIANAQLNSSAQAKVDHMIANGYFAHVSPGGVSWSSFINNAGYKYQAIGENLGLTNGSNSDVVSGWMNSSLHRNNLLSITAAYTDVGYGVGFASSITDPDSGIVYHDVWVTAAHYGLPQACSAGKVGTPPNCTTPVAPAAQAATPPPATSTKVQAAATATPVPTEAPTPVPTASPTPTPSQTVVANTESNTPAAPPAVTAIQSSSNSSLRHQTKVMIGFGGLIGIASLLSWLVLAVAPHRHWLIRRQFAYVHHSYTR